MLHFPEWITTHSEKIPHTLNFEMMLDYSCLLSSCHDFLRVDFYEIVGHFYFEALVTNPNGVFPVDSLNRFIIVQRIMLDKTKKSKLFICIKILLS